MSNHRSLSRRVFVVVVLAVLIAAGTTVVREEMRTSKWQARYLSSLGRQLNFKVEPGTSASIRYPQYGPYDRRLGYVGLPDFIERAGRQGFTVAAQARLSPALERLVDRGFYPVYKEKSQAGLRIADRDDHPMFSALYPQRVYERFVDVPPLILDTLLYIENRELLDERYPQVNPAVEWDRFGLAGLFTVGRTLGMELSTAGGSTLATQMEKYRHSPDGRTVSVMEKFRQMGSASLRAYLSGPETLQARRDIALADLNSIPLGATQRHGEVHGLGDGLFAWYGADFAEVNRLLDGDAIQSSETISPEQAEAYRQVLSLLLAQRRPAYYLGSGHDALHALTDSYLRLLVRDGVISASFRDAVLAAPRQPLRAPLPAASRPWPQDKTQNVLRTRLAGALGVGLYDLDRLDLSARTTIDYGTQQRVRAAFDKLRDPAEAQAAGVLGYRLLADDNDLDQIIYSLMLFERGEAGNLLRVQADNYDQPLDINEGIRIDLGSSAKLRTLVHYLEIIAELFDRYAGHTSDELRKVALHPRDHLSAWVIQELRVRRDADLTAILEAAMARRYSAGPGESFFTGGGLHRFENFNEDDDRRIMSVRDALRQSVNLVFIRMMRDIVYYHMYKPGGVARWLEEPDDPRHIEYLRRFADREGRIYLRRFFAKYRGKDAEESMALLTEGQRAKPTRLATLYRSVYPEHDVVSLARFLKGQAEPAALSKVDVDHLYDKYSTERFDLQDRGYITRVHPLEIWLVGYLIRYPSASLEEVIAASTEQRQEVYRWLFKTRRDYVRRKRIWTLLELEAFEKVHAAWKRLGYPFQTLTPSYASSIGASADRPAALAELMGILVNDGIRLPTVRFDMLHFAAGTPYETLMHVPPGQGQRVLAAEVAQVVRGALVDVVERGTAARVKAAYMGSDQKPLMVGGKTGTGDHRRDVFAKGGRLIESKVVSRAATFVFFLGDRFYGTMTAYVTGPAAAHYRFTSALPVQILKSLAPTLSPMLARVYGNDGDPDPAEGTLVASGMPTSGPEHGNLPGTANGQPRAAPNPNL